MSEVCWTAEQAAAITETNDLLLVANAGTGKTATVIAKILWRLGLSLEPGRDGDPLPPCDDRLELRQVAAITFTEKAAYDLKRKLREAIEASDRADELRWQIDSASIGTIHSFCAELLREHALRLEIDPTFRMLDERETWAEQDDVVRATVLAAAREAEPGVDELLQRTKLSAKGFQIGVVDWVRTAMRDLRWHPDRYETWETGGDLDAELLTRLAAASADPDDEANLAQVGTVVRLAHRALQEWERFLAEENVRDFDALILDARRLLTGPSASAALEGIRRRYRILIIDEFQDTDGAQRDIAFAIAGLDASGVDRAPQLFLVGDPKQSIYRFRGADLAVWNEVEERLRDQGVVRSLSTNFRCAPCIVDAVNAVCREAMGETGAALEAERLTSGVDYADLIVGVSDYGTSGMEWLVAQRENKSGTIGEDKDQEAAQLATRILEIVGTEQIFDPELGRTRSARFRDIAVLYRTRKAVAEFSSAMARAQIPYFVAGAQHLGERQEILDAINVLRLLRNPRDDYRALGFLRSPFVSLRDEVIARIALLDGDSLLQKARRFLAAGDWFVAPEGAPVSDTESNSLARALAVVEEARSLVHRLPLDEVLGFVLDQLGYRLHFLLAGRAEEPLANLQSFLQFVQEYRELDIAQFLEVWDRWDEQDNGLPQAPLYSKDDDVVTLTTIHAAKGLEWPIVFLMGIGATFRDPATHSYWSDPELGPILCPKKDERGPRSSRLAEREVLAGRAEESRLLYVAMTRARDRLIVVGPTERPNSTSTWLACGRDRVAVRGRLAEVPSTDSGSAVELDWLLDIPAPRAGGSLLEPTANPAPRPVVSATELMTRERDEAEWAMRYRHGVESAENFAPTREASDPGDAGVPATVRGTVIHGVLERIREEAELRRVLRETIGGLDDPDLEELLNEADYTEALEREIRRVIRSDEWAVYVEGEHYRELEFLHLAEPRSWRVGAFDLYRPGDPDAVIDFKTHEIEAQEAAGIAAHYAIQARIYREAAAIRGPAAVRLHFTGPNVVVEMKEDAT